MATFSLSIIVFSNGVQHEPMSRDEVLRKIEEGQFSTEDLAQWEINPAGAEWIPLHILLDDKANDNVVVTVAMDSVATKQNKLASPLVLLGILGALAAGSLTCVVLLRPTPEASSTTPAAAAADEKPAPLLQPATPSHPSIPASVHIPAPTLAKDSLAVAQEELKSPDPTPQGAELLAKAVAALDEEKKDDAEELLKQAKTAGVDQVALAAQYERLYRLKRDTAGEIRMLRYLVARPATSEPSLKAYRFRLGRHLSRKAAAEENATQAQSTYQEAINALSKVLDENPDDLDANLLAGLCYLSANNLDQAKKHFTIAYSKQSTSEEALSAMLTIALRQEDSDSIDKYSRLLEEMNPTAYNATYQPVVRSWKSLQWDKGTEKGKVFTAEARTILTERFNLSELKQVTEIPSSMMGTLYVIKVANKDGQVVRFPTKVEMGRLTSAKVYTSGKEDPPDMIHVGKAKTDDSNIFLVLTYRHGIKYFRKSSDYDASHIMQFMTMSNLDGGNEKIYYVDIR
ncbi:hypothetical protein DB346_13885 [Verrucomicrobia bacterium LW23]|nr:hypothetical protein DB346_13885 [Verrucomicrobia bacterium LW23]